MYLTSCPGSLVSSLRLVDIENCRRMHVVGFVERGNIRTDDREARWAHRRARNIDLVVGAAMLIEL